MSRPYQFSEEPKVTSPLDRQPPKPYADGQAPSFRQDINRAKTKKWVEAKSYSYEGDDWGEYDEDDEYGVGSPSQPQPPPKQQVGGMRSVTSPINPTAPTQLPRRPPSFDAGDERRAFSAAHPPPASSEPARPLQVNTTQSTAPVASAGSVTSSEPRSADKAVSVGNFPQPPAASADAPKIIRPADIYKRMTEERERQRLATTEANPPAVGQSESTAGTTVTAPPHDIVGSESQPATSPRVSLPPQLPAFRGSTFGGDDFWNSRAAQLKNIEESSAANQSQLEHTPSTGLRSMVNRAFDAPVKSGGVSKQDSLRSAAESSVSQADTTGTSDISPIIAPVSVASSSDLADHTPTADTGAPTALSNPTSHSNLRQVQDSSSMSPTIEETSQLPKSEIAKPGLLALSEDKAALTLPGTPDAAGREADLAKIARNVPEHALPQLSTSELHAQESFLERQPSPPAEMSTRIPRAESPTKGRVANLTSRFDAAPSAGVPDSPTSSHRSASPVKSSLLLTTQHGTTGAGLQGHSAELLSPTRPSAAREASFRPKLPGQWESYSNSAASASSEDEHEQAHQPAATAVEQEEEATQRTPTASRHPEPTVDLTPTTSKHPLPFRDVQQTPTGSTTSIPTTASAAASSKAVANAAQRSSRGDQYTLSPRTYGEIYQRPVSLGRFDSDVTTVPPTPLPKDDVSYDTPSVAAPSAAIASHGTEPLQPPRQGDAQHLGAEESPSDFESDRLHKEIVHTLSPFESPTRAHHDTAPAASALAAAASRPESSVLPSEYDSYWKEERPKSVVESTGPSGAASSKAIVAPATNVPAESEATLAPEPLITSSTDKPGYLKKRFSWETDGATPPATAASAATATIPAALTNTTTGDLEPTNTHSSTLSPEELRTEIPRLSGEGLHVVNAEPGEVVDTPANTPGANRGLESSQLGESAGLAESSTTGNASHTETSPLPLPPAASSTVRRIPGLPADPKAPSFREIMSIKSSQQRIETFNSTRDVWAKHETGLSAWIHSTVTNNPQHRSVLSNEQFTTPTETFTPRHRATSSIGGLFTKPTQDSPSQSTHQGNPNMSASAASSSPSQKLSTSHGAQKGKELLQSAGVLGGKGLSGAKGLFAKGRQKLKAAGGNDKVDN